MPINEPRQIAENIVQLPSARRNFPVPVVQAPRTQPLPPVLFPSWVATRDRAAAALLGGTRRLLLTGPAGTGKTVLIEHVARVLRAAGRPVLIQLADADPEPPGAGVTLFVDEADRLSAQKLKELLDEADGSVMLTGLAPLTRRVSAGTVQLTLEPLGQEEAREYIAEWLALNGRTPAELDSQAVRVLVELSGGVPRLLSTLLAAGVWLAKNGDAPVIEAAHIQEAAELRSVLGPPSPPGATRTVGRPARRRGVIGSAVLTTVVLVGAGAAIAPRLFPAEAARVDAFVTPFLQQADRWLRAEVSAPPTSEVQPPPPPAPAPAARVEPVPSAAEPSPAVAPEPAPPPPEPVQAAPEPPPVAPEPAREAPGPVSASPEPSPPEPVQAAPTPPEPVQATPEPPRADPAPPPAKPAAAPASPELPAQTVEILLRRGHEMLRLGDISAARLLFVRAAEGGSAEAMFEVGQTYDRSVLTGIGATGQSDDAEALRWYRRAAAKGNAAAERLLPKP